jgi:ABC-type glycerol-3-phosphate transport system substrate-binding protein
LKRVSIILFASLFMLSACGEDYYREASGSEEKTVVTFEMFEQIETGCHLKSL